MSAKNTANLALHPSSSAEFDLQVVQVLSEDIVRCIMKQLF